jgi:serine/threonine protein kinase
LFDFLFAYFKQIVYGLNYVHIFSVIHRDRYKPENILIASLSLPLIKIANWGVAAFAQPSLRLENSCGSPHYASPANVSGEKYQGNTTHIWSCSITLYAFLAGRLPFDDKNVRTVLANVKTGNYGMPRINPLPKPRKNASGSRVHHPRPLSTRRSQCPCQGILFPLRDETIRKSHVSPPLPLLPTLPLTSFRTNSTTPTPTNHKPRYIRPRAPPRDLRIHQCELTLPEARVAL